MDLYLVRHGQAKSPGDDPERGLTDFGMKQAQSTARWAVAAGACATQILHSGKRRAEETAEIFSRRLEPSHGLIQAQGLMPNDNVVPTAELVEAGGESLMIVGHLPFLPRLASLMTAGDPQRVGFAFMEAAVLCLHRSQGRWYVRWMVTPEQVGMEE